jgi:hypothetical protein
MADETHRIDPYETVLADLYAKRDQILQAIAAIESLRVGGLSGSTGANAGAVNSNGGKVPNGSMDGPGALLGMSIVDATKALLASKRIPLKNPDIAALFKAGGLHMNSKEPANTIGSVLTRRMADVGDVVRVGRGTWGLKEWYPNRSFKKDLKEVVQESEAAMNVVTAERKKRGRPPASAKPEEAAN